MTKYLFIFVLLISSLQAEVTVKVDRTAVKLNESIHVVFTSDANVQKQPDFKPLERDFDIISNQQSSSTRVINGKVDHSFTWTLTLVGKKEGAFTIPPIRFDQFQTDPVVIIVSPAAKSTKSDPVYLEVELNPSNEAYELSQMIYTVRIFHSVNVTGNISEIETSDTDAIIERLGDDKEYQQTNNGLTYLVLERKYAVIPQHAGPLTFAPVVFEGQMVLGGRSFFSSQTQYTRLSSEALSCSIKPIPAPFTKKNWLAANDVKLIDEWSSDVSKVQVGDAITRTITISADGCLASQIPLVAMDLPPDIKQYQDKPKTVEQLTATGNKGIVSMKTALIPSKAGLITLPAITVKWWDLKADKLRETSLPEVQLHVIDNAGTIVEPPAAEPKAPPILEATPVDLPIWVYVLISINGIVLIVLLALAAKKWIPSRTPQKEVVTVSQIKQSIKCACQKNDAKDAEKYLLQWAKETFPGIQPLNLTTIKEHLSDDLKESIEELNQSLYSFHSTWNGEALWQAFSSYKLPKAKSNPTSKNVLRNLYS